MRMMGIDPGSRKTGLAIIEKKGNKISYVASKVIRMEKIKEFNPRLKILFTEVNEFIKQWQPDFVSVESLIFRKGTTSLMKLAQARVCIMTALALTDLEIREYSPNLIKSTVTGHGHADKLGIQKIIQGIFPTATFTTDDESDALAIALCGIFNQPVTQQNWSKKSKKLNLCDSVKHAL